MAFWQSKGFTRAQAAGIVGNAKQESGLNPNETGGGLFQDIGSRASSGTGSLTHQLESAYMELLGSPTIMAHLKTAKTPQEAARVWSSEFERPSEPDLANREKYALEAYNGGGGGEGGSTIPGTILNIPVLGPALEGIEVGQQAAGGSTTIGGGIGEAVEAFGRLGTFFKDLTEPSTWLRLAEGLGGIILFMVGLKTLTRGSPTAGAANVAINQTRGVKGVAVKAGKIVAGVAK